MSEKLSAPWPPSELENVSTCPLCMSSGHKLLHEGLRDKVFYCAPGAWNSWRCMNCEAAWLDPRPTRDSIGRAYASYYTHQASSGRPRFVNERQRGLQGLVQRFRNGELNRRFGYMREPSLHPAWLSPVFAALLQGEAARLGRHIRQLPLPRSAAGRLLDVGAGNGDFLALAQTLGYRAEGLEADPRAVAAGRERGLALRQGTVPGAMLEAGAYEQITLNHVIEHLHDPLGALRELHEVLAPGGRIWVQTPNLDAHGHGEFGRDWRGLEPPRHLVLFNARALRTALERAGFHDVKLLAPAPEAKSYYRRSLAIVHELRSESDSNPYWNRDWKRRARRADRLARKCPERSESLTMTAWRRGASVPGT